MLGLQRKLISALVKARLFGGAAMIFGIEGQKFDEELEVESVGKGDLAFVHVVSRWEIEAGQMIRDITSPWYGEPSYYKRTNTMMVPHEKLDPPLEESSLGYDPGATLIIHPSRVVRLIGLDYPDLCCRLTAGVTRCCSQWPMQSRRPGWSTLRSRP